MQWNNLFAGLVCTHNADDTEYSVTDLIVCPREYGYPTYLAPIQGRFTDLKFDSGNISMKFRQGQTSNCPSPKRDLLLRVRREIDLEDRSLWLLNSESCLSSSWEVKGLTFTLFPN